MNKDYLTKFVDEFNSKNHGDASSKKINMKSFMAKNCESPTVEQMKKNSEKAYKDRQVENNNLIQAYTEKKLKSPRLIKKAKGLANEAVTADN